MKGAWEALVSCISAPYRMRISDSPAIGMCHRQSRAVFGERNRPFFYLITLLVNTKMQHNTHEI